MSCSYMYLCVSSPRHTAVGEDWRRSRGGGGGGGGGTKEEQRRRRRRRKGRGEEDNTSQPQLANKYSYSLTATRLMGVAS